MQVLFVGSAWGTDPDYFEPQTLSQVNDSLFSVIIERENTDIEFNYYLQLGEFDGLEIAYPNAAPENYHTLLLGPDLILPMIDSLSNLPQAHYLLPVKQYVTVVGIWDDRFGVQTPVLGWEFPDGTTGSAEMELTKFGKKIIQDLLPVLGKDLMEMYPTG